MSSKRFGKLWRGRRCFGGGRVDGSFFDKGTHVAIPQKKKVLKTYVNKCVFPFGCAKAFAVHNVVMWFVWLGVG